MIAQLIKKSCFHVLAWCAMLAYFVFAPNLFSSIFTEYGKPIRVNGDIPADSSHITFVVDGFEPYIKEGENLFNLHGWALIAPDEVALDNVFVREIVLVSDDIKYSFSVVSVHRNPSLLKELTDMEIDLDTLGFHALISEDAIRPGKYRVGIIFRNSKTGLAYYADKPSWYLVRTPNAIALQK